MARDDFRVGAEVLTDELLGSYVFILSNVVLGVNSRYIFMVFLGVIFLELKFDEGVFGKLFSFEFYDSILGENKAILFNFWPSVVKKLFLTDVSRSV